jgi:hypothetical protein
MRLTLEKREETVKYDVPDGNRFSVDEKGTVKVLPPRQRKPKVPKEPSTNTSEPDRDETLKAMTQRLANIEHDLNVLITLQLKNPEIINNFNTINYNHIVDCMGSMKNVTEGLQQILPPKEYLE